jgi:hypothetical protein
MTESQQREADVHLIQLIISFQTAAMMQMGKIQNPGTGQIERNLEQAQNTIELLAMLERLTEGNLIEEETRLLSHALYELRMNYVDEKDRPEPAPETQAAEEKPTPDDPDTTE